MATNNPCLLAFTPVQCPALHQVVSVAKRMAEAVSHLGIRLLKTVASLCALVFIQSLSPVPPYSRCFPQPLRGKQTAMLWATLWKGCCGRNTKASSQRPVRNWGQPTSAWVDGDLTGPSTLPLRPSPDFSSLLVEGISLWPHRYEKRLCLYLKLRGSHAEEIIISPVQPTCKVQLQVMRMRQGTNKTIMFLFYFSFKLIISSQFSRKL